MVHWRPTAWILRGQTEGGRGCQGVFHAFQSNLQYLITLRPLKNKMKSVQCNFFLNSHSQPLKCWCRREIEAGIQRYCTTYHCHFCSRVCQPFEGSSVQQRMTADVRKAVRNSVSGQADRCKALEAHPPGEGKQVSLIVVDPAPC